MNFKKLILTKINNITTEIRLNDPDIHNALTLDIINELSLGLSTWRPRNPGPSPRLSFWDPPN